MAREKIPAIAVMTGILLLRKLGPLQPDRAPLAADPRVHATSGPAHLQHAINGFPLPMSLCICECIGIVQNDVHVRITLADATLPHQGIGV
jgi:hypothetical protein